MKSVKILHIADAHIGRKYANLSPEKASVRFSEVLLTLEETINRFSDAFLVLMSGDIFEETCPESAVMFVSRIFSRHTDKHFFISCGNHDCRESEPIKLLSKESGSNVHIFGDTIEKVSLEDINVNVYGVSFSAPSSYTSLLRGFRAEDEDYINIMVLHADAFSDSRYNPISKDDIFFSNLDYIALGHVHSFSGLHKSGDVCYAYPGVLEPGGFDETGKCGVIYGDISRNRTELEFYPVSKREYHSITIDITNLTCDEDVISAVRQTLNTSDLYKVTLSGFRKSFCPNINLYNNIIDSFYIEFSDNSENTENIFDYVNEFSLRGKTAKALLEYKETIDPAVFDKACEIITNLMCKG